MSKSQKDIRGDMNKRVADVEVAIHEENVRKLNIAYEQGLRAAARICREKADRGAAYIRDGAAICAEEIEQAAEKLYGTE